MPNPRREPLLRRLHLRMTTAWVLAWLLCVASLTWVAVATHARLGALDLESLLQLRATAVYGLTWFDQDGRFHDELLRKEQGVLDDKVDIWVIAPGSPQRVLLAPPKPRFNLASRFALASQVVRDEQTVAREGLDANGRRYRLYARVTYDDADAPRAAILVVADPRVRDAAHAAFNQRVAWLVAVLAAFGIALGNMLSRRALRPVMQSFDVQKRFIASAAHELRSPVASLQAICESADTATSCEQALRDTRRIVGHTAGVVEKLLLMARLDAPNARAQREPLRLDLLVESLLPEDVAIEFSANQSVVQADPHLLRAAVRNLLENGLRHGARNGAASLKVRVQDRCITVEDGGPGFPADTLRHAGEPFQAGPHSAGAGLGLSIVQHVAWLHGGRLRLQNLQPHGAKASLEL